MGLCYMEIHELFGNVKCGMLNCVYEREKKKSVLKCIEQHESFRDEIYFYRLYINRGR